MSTETETELTIDEKIDLAKHNMKVCAQASTIYAFAALTVLSIYVGFGFYDLPTRLLDICMICIAMVGVYVFASRLLSNYLTFLELLAEKHAH